MDMMGTRNACLTMALPTFWSKMRKSSASSFLEAYKSALPPPGTMPSSTAARVALRASFKRSFTSWTSTSDAPPTLMTATPPDSLAKRSLSLSFSYSDVVASTAAWIWSHLDLSSSLSPAPSRTTVSSFVTVSVLHVPRTLDSNVSSSFPPVSSLMSSAPVNTARSCNIAFRWSPKPGAFTAASCNPPRSLLTTIVAKASPSTSSATMNKGRCTFAACSSTGRMAWTLEIFLSYRRTSGSVRFTFCAFESVMKCGEMNPRSNFMPSTTSNS
mmetsp:Transcript_26251/g.73440  ORF Transcript_26251/g.73440 Transcript_26251/m.73440 type:complete len:271 (-) Transcript_26251:702-1514(-)